MNRAMSLLMMIVLVGLTLALPSCRRTGHHVCPVTGTVLYQGKPAEWAQVTFVSLIANDSKKPKPGGTVGPDGTFRLSTYASYDGAPPGNYAVLVVLPSPSEKVDGENAGPDLLKGRYANPKTTPLRAEIKEGSNELPPFNVQ